MVLPGLINTHHHFYQTLARAYPPALDKKLCAWLRALYPVWRRPTPETLAPGVRVAMAQLMFSGCTTTDHHHVFPPGLENATDIEVDEARRLGLRVVLVIEKPGEWPLIHAEAREMGVTPMLGVRLRLSVLGKGNWQNTGGERAKFGLAAGQLTALVADIRDSGCIDWLRLLHFHMGSQIANLRDIADGRDLGDTTTLRNPEIVEDIQRKAGDD